MNAIPNDIINYVSGIRAGSNLDLLRGERPEAKINAQESYCALFAPQEANDVSLAERFALAVFTAGLHGDADLAAFYAEGLAATGASGALLEAARALPGDAGSGPYGRYPSGPLSAEDEAGPAWQPPQERGEILGPRLAAAFEHAHMLTFHPRDSSQAALQSLLDAGWSSAGVVTVSQLISFLAYQARLVHGLRVMARAMNAEG